MQNMIVGFFDHKTNKVDLERDFAAKGFSNDDYVIYVDNDATEFLVSANISSNETNQSAVDIFSKYQPLKIFNFENMSGPLKYLELKKIIELNAQAEVLNLNSLIFNEGSEGINDEVAF